MFTDPQPSRDPAALPKPDADDQRFWERVDELLRQQQVAMPFE